MSTFSELKKAVRRAGGTLVCESFANNIVWQIEAPDGKLWVEGGVQWIRVDWQRGDSAWRDDAIQDAMSRLQHGLEPKPADFIG